MALVWKPGEIQRLPPAESPKPTHAVIPTAQIAAHVGQRIQLLTEGGRRVDGELKSVDATNRDPAGGGQQRPRGAVGPLGPDS
jgi:hypothetical protein